MKYFFASVCKTPLTDITFTIALCSVILPVWIPVNGSTADALDNSPHSMPPVVVTATRSPISEQDVAANITVITSDQLDQMPATSVAQALEYVPGVSIQFNGGPGSQADGFRIQGSEIRHVTVYQDGVPLSQLVNPRTDLSLLPLSNVERIEIYKGAASAAWGSALGGVVNIITKEPDDDKPINVDAKSDYGTHATSKSYAGISGTFDDLSWLLSYTHEQSDGFIEHTDYKIDAVYTKLNYNLSKTSRLNLALAHNQAQNADPILNDLEFGEEHFWDDIERQFGYQRLLFETKPTTGVVLNLEARHRQTDSTIEDVFSDRREPFLNYEEEIWGAGALMDWKISKDNSLVTGLDVNWGRFNWKPFEDPRQTDHTGDWALYANGIQKLGAVTINAGARYDSYQDYGSAVSPTLGAVYNFYRLDALIRAQVAKGFSAPDFAWVNDPTFGNPDLRSEHAVNYQLGGEIHPIEWLQMEVNLFRANVKDLILFDNETQRYQNVEKVTRSGFEWGLQAKINHGLSLRFGGSHTDVRDDITDIVIKDIPRTQYNLSLLHTQGGMSHSLLGKYVDNNSSFPETHDKTMLFDYQFKYKFTSAKTKGAWTLYGSVYNLLNTDYLLREVWPQPGRRGEIGIQWNF